MNASVSRPSSAKPVPTTRGEAGKPTTSRWRRRASTVALCGPADRYTTPSRSWTSVCQPPSSRRSSELIGAQGSRGRDDADVRKGTRGRLIVLCGLPGSGKTTTAKRLERAIGAVRLCPDEWMIDLRIDLWDSEARWRVHALQWRLAQDLLALDQKVILEWGVWARSERDELRLACRELGAAVELHHLDVPIDVLAERVAQRQATEPWTTVVIERGQLEAWA